MLEIFEGAVEAMEMLVPLATAILTSCVKFVRWLLKPLPEMFEIPEQLTDELERGTESPF